MSENVASLPQKELSKPSGHVSGHNRGADTLKFLLTPFICFWAFGFPEGSGLVSTLSGFAVPAFFILSGYFVLEEHRTLSGFAAPAFFILSGYFVLEEHRRIRWKKMQRAIERSALTFVLMIVCYFLLNLALLTAERVNWMQVIHKRMIFNFVVLNVWPFNIGSNIWFVQSLLYAYIILLIVSRFRGMKYYKIIMALSMIFMVLTGELAGLIGFRVYDYTYIPGGALTRALPYVLLGRLLREKREKLETVKGWVYCLVFALGAGLAVGEIYLLDYLGKLYYDSHMIGFGVMAAACCGWAVSRPHMKRTFFSKQGRKYAKRVYVLANPVYYGMLLITSWKFPQFFENIVYYAGPIVFAVCLLICVFITLVEKWISKRRSKRR